MKRLLAAFALVGLVTGSLIPALGTNDCLSSFPVDVQSSMQHRVNSGLNVGIVAGVMSDCGMRFCSYGTMGDSEQTPVDENTLFEIGSSAKPLTALLLADAVCRGELSLAESINSYLPSTVTPPATRAGASILFRHLATHTSGLSPIPKNLAPSDENNPYADYTVTQLYEAISGYQLTSLGRYTYSNLGMGLLGHLLELKYGTSYEALVIERIADVLGMPDTRMTLSNEQRSRLATSYRDGEVFPVWDNPTLAGAGGLLSTARDCAVFLSANLGLLDSPLDEAMQMTHQVYVSGDMPVGLAWHMRKTGGKTIVEHHGATGGCWSYIGFVLEDQIGVVVLTNTFEDIDDIGIHMLDPFTPLKY